MSDWKSDLRDDPTEWLLERDRENPGVRYFTLMDLYGRDPGDSEVREAQKAVMRAGPVPVILEAQNPEGFGISPVEGTLRNIKEPPGSS